MSLSEITGAPSPITIGDKQYNASPLSLYELGALEEKLRASLLASAALAGKLLPAALAERVIDRALIISMAIHFDSPQMTAVFLPSFGGKCALLALSLRAMHPEMTEAELGKLLSKRQDQLDAAIDTVKRISDFGGTGEAKGSPPTGEA